MTEWLLVLLVLVLIALNALFVAGEFALVTADRNTVAARAEAGDKRSRSLAIALSSMSTQLSGAQLGITVTSLLIGYIAEPSVATLLREALGLTDLSRGAAAAIALTLGFVLVTVSQMVFGELVPKNWAISQPVRVGRAVAGIQRAFTFAFKPAIRVLNGSANKMVRALGIEPQEQLASARSAQELASLATRSAAHGTLDHGTARLVERSLEFGDRTAADVMTPRPRVRFLDADEPVAVVLSLAASTGHARFPVLGESVDDVVGIVHFKHALAVPAAERATRPARDIAHPVREVPSAMPLDAVLEVLRGGLQLAVVRDEYGGTDGIVTLEDLVEEIVGEIEDEQDRPIGRHRMLSEGTWLLSGLLRPDEVEDITGVDLPEGEDSDTLAGLLTERLERFGEVGDVVELDARDTHALDEDGIAPQITVRLRVVRLDGRRIDRIVMSRAVAPPPTGGDDG